MIKQTGKKRSKLKWIASVLMLASAFAAGCERVNPGSGDNPNPAASHEKIDSSAPSAAQGTALSAPKTGAAAAKPNVIVIMADDLGYGDTSLYGNSGINTPNIKSIADNGILFMQAYAAAPVCNPSRMSLFSSMPPGYLGGDNNYAGRTSVDRIPAYTLPNAMKEKGYISKYVGKWDLGTEEKYMPVARGFDDFFGIPGGVSNYYPKQQNEATRDAWHLEGKRAVKGGAVVSQWPIIVRKYNPASGNYMPANEQQFLTDAFTREALSFIDAKSGKPDPFFLYLSYNAPHLPLQAPDDHYQKYAQISDPKQRIYAAMVDALDEGVGKVLNKLDEKGIRDNTMVLFVSDNGPEAGSSGGLRGRKYHVFEGGVRVPFAMEWPAKFAKNKKVDDPISLMDVLPTLAAAAGHDVPKLISDHKFEGVDLTPYLTDAGHAGKPHQDFYWRYYGDHNPFLEMAISSNNLKYVRAYDEQNRATEYLFDLAADSKETNNLFSDAKYKSAVDTIKSKLDLWNESHPINPNVGKGESDDG